MAGERQPDATTIAPMDIWILSTDETAPTGSAVVTRGGIRIAFRPVKNKENKNGNEPTTTH